MIFYKLNIENVIVRQFKVFSNLYRLKGLIDKLREKSRRVILFGSCAEGTDVKGSDIDISILTDQKSEEKALTEIYHQ